jgi:hypothetical protein
MRRRREKEREADKKQFTESVLLQRNAKKKLEYIG